MSAKCNKFYQNLCRVCLLPEGVEYVKSLIDDRESSDVSQKISSFFITKVDLNKNEVNFNEMLCHEDASRIKTMLSLIEQVSQAEKCFTKYNLKAIHQVRSSKSIDLNYGFEICRACLSAQPVDRLLKPTSEDIEILSLFGLKADNLNTTEDILLCENCSRDLNSAQMLIMDAKLSEEIYIESRLEEEEIAALINAPYSNQKSAKRGSKKFKIRLITSSAEQKLNHDEEETILARSGFKCEICERISKTKGDLKRHIERLHVKVKKFACDSCPKMFFFRHELVEHDTRNHKKKRQIYNSSLPFKCTELNCNKFFKSEHYLKKHQKSHSDERPFGCWCKKSFKFRSQLKTHQQRHERKNKSFNLYGFGGIKKLKTSDDISTIPLINGYPCWLCDRLLCTKIQLRIHIASVHKIKFSCDICSEVFWLKDDLKKHIIDVHVYKGDLHFNCDYAGCKRRYSSKNGLQEHKKKQNHY